MEEKETVVLFHRNCDDGFGAAFVAYLVMGLSAEYIGMKYGDNPPNVKGKNVYVFDFSFSPEVLLEMGAEAKSIHMLDHHLSAAKSWEPLLDGNGYFSNYRNVHVKFDMTRSGAGLAWEYFFPTKKMPMLIRHIQDNDLWKFSVVNTKYFIRNLRSYDQCFDTWKMFFSYRVWEGAYKEFVREGVSQERFFGAQVNAIHDLQKPSTAILGNSIGLALNANEVFSSEIGHLLSVDSGTFGMVYCVIDDKVKCSLRSSGEFDVSVLAKLYGGGGHRNASGMVVSIDTFFKEILQNGK